jgi:FtsP/CotA-like multicopper oxidase with cupredoxin domain
VVKFNVIGNDGGFVLGPPVVLNTLLIGIAERYDVIVDFTHVSPGTQIILRNTGPDSPFGGFPIASRDQANPATTGQVMRFDVVAATAPDTSAIPASLNPPPDGHQPAVVAASTRIVTLNENESTVANGPSSAELGNAFGPDHFLDAITEDPTVGKTEYWQIVDRTEDAHPIHLHQTQFEVVGRLAIDVAAWSSAVAACQSDPRCKTPPNPENFAQPGATFRPTQPWEVGQKDTIIALPGEVTKLKALFDIPGLYVWHCHIVSHEDNEMMRPYCAVPANSTVRKTCPKQ